MKLFKEILSIICIIGIIGILCSQTYQVYAVDPDSNILGTTEDGKGHQGLKMTVEGSPTDNAIQAFCIGWVFTFESLDGTLYTTLNDVMLATVDKTGGSRDYTFPLTEKWTKISEINIKGGNCLEDFAVDKTKFENIIKKGCTVTANAIIEKYSYSSSAGYTALGIIAKNESQFRSKFSEFGASIETIVSNFYNWTGNLDPQTYDHTINVKYWDAATNTPLGITQTIKVDGVNVLTSVTRQFKLDSTISESDVTGYRITYSSSMPTFNTDFSSWNKTLTFPLDSNNDGDYALEDEGWLHIRVGSDVPDTGTVHVKGIDSETNDIIYSDDIADITYGTSKTVPSPTIDNYTASGSYVTTTSSIPSKSNMDSDSLSRTVSPTESKPNVYVWFWYYKINPSGAIHITCLDYSTNDVIDSSAISSQYNIANTVSAPMVEGYSSAKGSYLTYTEPNNIPSNTNMGNGVTGRIVTLTTTNPNAYVYFWYDEISEPVAVIDAPETVQAGETFTVDGSRSYGTSSPIETYNWTIPENTDQKTESQGASIAEAGSYTIKLKVTDSNGLTDSTTTTIEVTPPYPVARIGAGADKRENRKVSLSAEGSTSTEGYPIEWDEVEWNIEPVESSGATWEMGVRLEDGTVYKSMSGVMQKYVSGTWVTTDDDLADILKGETTFYFQARYAGNYTVTLTVENEYPAKDTQVGIITVAKDAAPVADCNAQAATLREYDNPLDSTQRKFSKIPVTDASYSPDGDTIASRTWGYRWNSQNNYDSSGNAIFIDDTTKYKYTSSSTTAFLPSEQRLIVDNANDSLVEIWTYDVGWYSPEVTVVESIPDSTTIKELLLLTDIRSTTINGWQ